MGPHAHQLRSGGPQGGPGEIWGGPQAPSAAANGLEAMYLIALGIPEIDFLLFLLCFYSFSSVFILFIWFSSFF